MSNIDNGGELKLPDWGIFLTAPYFIPYVIYLILFFIFGALVQKYTWQNYTGFKRYRLENLTVSLIHASTTGLCALLFTIIRPNEMFFNAIHWYEPWATHILLFSMAYFVYDAVNIARNEQSRYTVELFLHHGATIFVFSCAVFSQKFLLYAFWALLMEVSSIFLHIRTISTITGFSKSNPECHKKIQIINITACLIFRFGVQIWQISYIFYQKPYIHPFYFGIGCYGGLLFLLSNASIIFRIIVSDGFVGDKCKKYVPLNRDDDNKEE
uniref:TLC domain-containing protein n=1 Tax=Parastrongyloides trichosuri TaxID=131310 RepID=A0A0N5A392_PARTI